MNRKRVQRLWREEGLRVPVRPPKRRRVGTSTVPADRLHATRPNEVWAMDFLFDTTSDGRPFKVLAMCDEFTRESIGGALARSITADHVVVVLDEAVARRGAPSFIRCDNGPEFTAAAIRDWCGLSGTGSSFIEPGSPWQNPWVESFNGKARDELFAREVFDTILEARVLYEDWREIYNHRRPHSSLGYRAPADFAAVFTKAELCIESGPTNGDRSTLQGIATIREFFWELSLGIYCIVKGFKPSTDPRHGWDSQGSRVPESPSAER